MMKHSALTLTVFCLLTAAMPAAHAQDAVAPASTPTSLEQIKLSYAPIVKKVAPAVVNIYSRRTVSGRAANPFMNDPFFAPFFQNTAPMKKRVEQALGTGFIADASGLIVTNAHVVKDAEEINVVLADGREFPAKSVLVDTPSDLGLLRIDPKGLALPVAKLAPSETLEVGDLVLAIGNPFGVGQTVTSGIVSALARSNTDINDFDFFIQTDAAINPGNSGGPLVGMDGTVIGVNSAIYSRSGGSLGIGFAIPSEMVQAVITAEKSGQIGKRGVVRPWLGFTAQNMTADIAQSLGFEHPQGALVAQVTQDGPADKAGLRSGDVITAINDKTVRDADELKFRIAMTALGQNAHLTINRAGTEQTLAFTAAAPPENPPRAPITIEGKNPLQGATIINVSPAVIEDMGLNNIEDGVVVLTVREGSIAERMGLQANDGIIALANRRIQDTAQLSALMKQPDARTGGWVLTIRRNGRDQTVILR